MGTLPPRRPDGQPLRHALEHQARMLLAYYGELNGDCDRSGFPAALQRLYEDVRPSLGPSGHPLDGFDDQIKAQISDFTRQWRLPHRHGGSHVLASLRRASRGRPLKLSIASRALSMGRIGTPVVYASEENEGLLVREHLPTIYPWVVLPIPYDPRICSRAELRQHAKSLARTMVDNIIEQAAALEREVVEQGEERNWEAEQQAAAEGRQPEPHGWSPIPPRHSDPAELRRMARRLYRAAVMRRNNEEILGLEARDHSHDDSYEPCTPQAVSKSVLDWASALDIPLPRR